MDDKKPAGQKPFVKIVIWIIIIVFILGMIVFPYLK